MANLTPEEISEILTQFFDVTGKRQYIGARYVPTFGRKDEPTIQWDGGIAPYEPLTIVLYQGNSYTSRTYVPSGIDILNQDYWANTGNYNAQVETYRQEVLEFDGRINANSNDIVDIKSLIPTSDFSSENTIKDYIDKKSLFKYSYMFNAQHICNMREYSSGSAQGGCPIFVNDTLVGYCVMFGSDDSRYFRVIDLNTCSIIGQVSIGTGHYGNVSCDNNGHCYSYNYTSDSPNYGKLLIINVSNLSNPYVEKTVDIASLAGSRSFNMNFYYKDGFMLFGNRTAASNTSIDFYRFDINRETLEDDVFLTIETPNIREMAGSSPNWAHFNYDAISDTFNYSGYNPLGFALFDGEGKFRNTVGCPKNVGCTDVGEIEEVTIHGDKIYFHSNFKYTTHGGTATYLNTKTSIFMCDINNGLNEFDLWTAIGSNTIHIDYNQYKPYTKSASTVTFKYVEDAIIYARLYVNSYITLTFDTEYPIFFRITAISDLTIVNTFTPHPCIIQNVGLLEMRSFLTRLSDDVNNEYIVAQSQNVVCYITHCNIRENENTIIGDNSEMIGPAFLVLFNKCNCIIRSLNKCFLMATTLHCNNVYHCSVSEYTSLFYYGNLNNNTYDETSVSIQMTRLIIGT